MVALGFSVGVMHLTRRSDRLRVLAPLVAFPFFAVADLWAIYHELKAVQIRQLNRERAEMVAGRWLQEGRVPSVAEVSDEHLPLAYANERTHTHTHTHTQAP